MRIAAIDAGKLFELVWASAIAGIFVAVCFSLVIVGITKVSESRRNDRSLAATAYGLLSVLAMLAFLGTAVFGISVIASK
jgi:hypothetical protein